MKWGRNFIDWCFTVSCARYSKVHFLLCTFTFIIKDYCPEQPLTPYECIKWMFGQNVKRDFKNKQLRVNQIKKQNPGFDIMLLYMFLNS